MVKLNKFFNQGRLAQVGSDTFSYDAMGNPIVYKGNTFTWEQGRKLAKIGNSITYSYDGNGMRFKKTAIGAIVQ